MGRCTPAVQGNDEAGPGRGRRNLLIALALALLTLATYRDVAHYDFAGYDDREYVQDNPLVAGGLTLGGAVRAFTTIHAANWHPLTWLSHMLDVELFGMRPGIHHLHNLLLHAATAVLLFTALASLTGAIWRSAFAAALFAVHPLHVESVAWIAERKDVLAGLFLALALIAWRRYARAPSARLMAVVAALLACGLLAKPLLVTLPFALVLLDYWPLGRLRPAGGAGSGLRGSITLLRAFTEKIPLFLLAGLSATATLIAQREKALQSLDQFPFTERAVNAAAAWVTYLARTAWPAGLTVFYPHLGRRLGVWDTAAALVLLVAMSLAAWLLRPRVPALLTGWLWYLGTLVPMIGLVQVGRQGMADRYTYLPLIGIFIAAAWAVPAPRATRARALVAAAGLGVLLALSFAATRQVGSWRDEVSLFERAVAVNPRDPDAHARLGDLALARGDSNLAVGQYQAALREAPASADLRYNLANALAAAGRPGEAEPQYLLVLEATPGHAPAHNNLGVLLERMGRRAEAEAHFRRSLELVPRNADAENNLGLALMEGGRGDEAAGHFARALAIDAAYWKARYNLARLLQSHGRADEALALYREVLRINPGHLPSRAAVAALGGR